MDAMYVLAQLLIKAQQCRKAQKEYYKIRAPMEDSLKQAALSEAKRREFDLDQAIDQLPKLIPDLKAHLTHIESQ